MVEGAVVRALLLLALPSALLAQPRSTKALGIGATAFGGAPSWFLALAWERQRFPTMRSAVEAGYIGLGTATTEYKYEENPTTDVTERWRVRRGMWYLGWVAHAGRADATTVEWLAATGIAHLRRDERISSTIPGTLTATSFHAHATGPLIGLGLARRYRGVRLEARVTTGLFMDEGLVSAMRVGVWAGRRRR